jgi:hypothetical protein
MLTGLLALPRASVELTEAEVPVGDEGSHAELAGERQRLPVRAFGVVRTRRRRDVTGEAEHVGLACPSSQPAGECQGLSGMASGLVDPPDREVGGPSIQKNERRPEVSPTTAELLDGARHQRDRLVSAAGESVGGPESGGGERCPEGDLLRSREVETLLQDPGRASSEPR